MALVRQPRLVAARSLREVMLERVLRGMVLRDHRSLVAPACRIRVVVAVDIMAAVGRDATTPTPEAVAGDRATSAVAWLGPLPPWELPGRLPPVRTTQTMPRGLPSVGPARRTVATEGW